MSTSSQQIDTGTHTNTNDSLSQNNSYIIQKPLQPIAKFTDTMYLPNYRYPQRSHRIKALLQTNRTHVVFSECTCFNHFTRCPPDNSLHFEVKTKNVSRMGCIPKWTVPPSISWRRITNFNSRLVQNINNDERKKKQVLHMRSFFTLLIMANTHFWLASGG